MKLPSPKIGAHFLRTATLIAGMSVSGSVWAQAVDAAPEQPAAAPATVQTLPTVDAQQPSPAPVTETAIVACFVPPAKLASEAIAEFLGDPQALLTGTEAGGMILSGRVGGLAGSSSETLDKLVSLSVTANKEQVAAIGAGLARAAKACAKASPDYAALIQTKVAEMNSQGLSLAFANALSDVETASLGTGAAGGASSGASGIGGDGTAGGGSAGTFDDEFVVTTSGEFDGMRDRSAFNVTDSNDTGSRLVSPN